MSVSTASYDRSHGEEHNGGRGELLEPNLREQGRAASCVSRLKQELSDWRARVGDQVRVHRGEVADLQEMLTTEMATAQAELAAAKARVRRELGASEALLASLQAAKEAEREY